MFRVLSAQLAHETNTFSSRKTTLADYRARACYRGQEVPEVFRGTNTEIGGHILAASEFSWKMSHSLVCSATPSGPTRSEDWQELKRMLLADAAGEHFDGIVIAFHGAMVAEGEDDAEGALLEALREIVGPEIPIVVSVDLHANVSDRMAGNSNAILAYKTYPHVDQSSVGYNTCSHLQTMMETGELSRVELWRLPTLVGCDFGRTDGDLMPRLLEMCRGICEDDDSCTALEICAGFPWSDVEFCGPSVAVTWRGSDAPGKALVEPLLREIWNTKTETSVDFLTADEAMQVVREWSGPGPLVLADAADNPGAGGYGDSSNILRKLIEIRAERAAVAAIADPDAIRRAVEIGVGGTGEFQLGVLYSPENHRLEGLRCRARVRRICDGDITLTGPMMTGMKISLGTTAVLDVEGILVVVSTNNMQVFDRSFFVEMGIAPEALNVLVVKSSHHFKSDFRDMAGKMQLVDAGGIVSPDIGRLEYRKIRRPIVPLDDDVALPG